MSDRFATYWGRAHRTRIDGVDMVRGQPIPVPTGKLTVLRKHPDVVVADDDTPTPPTPPEPDTDAPQEA